MKPNEPILLTKEDLPYLGAREIRLLMSLRSLYLHRKNQPTVGTDPLGEMQVLVQWKELERLAKWKAAQCARIIRLWRMNTLFVDKINKVTSYWKLTLIPWKMEESETNPRLVSVEECFSCPKLSLKVLASARSLGKECTLQDLSEASKRSEKVVKESLIFLDRSLDFDEKKKIIRHKTFL